MRFASAVLLLPPMLLACDGGQAPLEPADPNVPLWTANAGTWGGDLKTDGEHVYITGSGAISALDAVSGETRWCFQLAHGVRITGPAYARMGDLVVAAQGEAVVGLGVADGVERWRRQDPAIEGVAFGPDRLYVRGESSLAALDPRTGLDLWSESLVGTGSVELSAGVDRVCVRRSPIPVVACHSAEDGRLLWSTVVEEALGKGPIVVAGNRVVTTAREGAWVALDAATGVEVWRRDPPGALGAARDDTLYTCAEDGCAAVRAADGGESWRTAVEGGPIGISDRWLFVNGRDVLAVLDRGTGEVVHRIVADPPPPYGFEEAPAGGDDRVFAIIQYEVRAYSIP